jgi:hypothetical protein
MKIFILKFEKNRPYHSREMKKMKYCVWAIKKILKWKTYGKNLFMWGSKPLLTVGTANRLVLQSLEVVHFHHSRVNVLGTLNPTMLCKSRHNNTLPRCDCIGTLRGLYKNSQICDNPLSLPHKGMKYGMNPPPSGATLGWTCRRTTYDPLPFRWDYPKLESLIIYPSQSHVECGSTIFMGGRSMFRLTVKVLQLNHHISHRNTE